MIVGIPKEIKNNEYRVSLTPAGAMELVRRGHTVYIQSGAGVDSGFADKEYQAVGAKLLPTIEEVYATAEMIIKVKEPIAPEYGLVRPGQLLFTYFHFASSEALTRAMIASGAVCCAYETVERSDRSLPLLIPMSEVAGRMAAQEGRYFLEKPRGGKGILLGGVPGVKPAKVFVIGAGVVGTAAARTAAGTGADVTICDVSLRRLTYLADVMPRNVKTLMSSEYNIREELKHADLVVGSVLIPGAKAPKLVTRDMLKLMEPGTVMVDVAIDQGGCFETSRPTTHEDPVYYVDGILHYCVANIPGAVPYTSTLALTNATLPYALQLADKGWRRACAENEELRLGLNIVEGKVVYRSVAEAWGSRCKVDPHRVGRSGRLRAAGSVCGDRMLFGFGGRLRSCGRRNMRRRAGGAFAYLPEFAYIRLSKKRIMIKNLVFDFGGIIADFEFSRALAAFERVGLKNPAEYLDSYHQRGFFRELESGRIGADEFVRRLGECAGREVSYAEAREAWLGFFLLPVPLERLACLEELRRDYRLYVLSNTNPFVMDWARSSEFSPAGKPLDAYFDKLFLSYEMKCMKPDRAIFDRMAAEAPLVPAETLFIDDSAANAAAGAALGYRTFCPRSNSDWREEVRRILGAGV